MKILNLYAFIYTLIQSTNAMQNTMQHAMENTKKLCKDCKYFIPNIECAKFGQINLVTGEKSYEFAKFVRDDPKKCGEDGISFEKNNYKIISLPYYFLKKNWIPTLILLPIMLQILLLVYAFYVGYN